MPDRDLKSAARWIARAALAACMASLFAVIASVIASVIALAIVIPVSRNVMDIVNGETPAAVAARQRYALAQFVTCAKNDDAIDPAKLDDFHTACAGYSTLAEAYRTQKVPPPG